MGAFTERGGVEPKPGQAPDIQQQRASLNRLFSTPQARSNSPTTGNEPLVVDLIGPSQGTHWVINFLTARGEFTVRNLVAGVDSPIAGFFIVPDGGTTDIESLTDANAAGGWNIRARGTPIPVQWKTVALNVGTRIAFACVAVLSTPLIIPNGYTIRFIGTVAPGTATPGPGAASFAQVEAWGAVERDIV